MNEHLFVLTVLSVTAVFCIAACAACTFTALAWFERRRAHRCTIVRPDGSKLVIPRPAAQLSRGFCTSCRREALVGSAGLCERCDARLAPVQATTPQAYDLMLPEVGGNEYFIECATCGWMSKGWNREVMESDLTLHAKQVHGKTEH